jgi:SprB repeat/HmuY protein
MRKLLLLCLIPVFFISCDNDDDPKVEDIVLTTSVTDVTSAGDDGKIDLTVVGGKLPYTFAWSNGESTEDIENLAEGIYTVTVTDANSETASATDTVNGPEGPSGEISLSMGAGYANDVFFSLTTGVVKEEERANWDIGFYTNPQSSSIITNGGQGVVLYTYPNGAAADWATVDTAGLATWTPMYNNVADTTWQNGAFDRNALGHPDYGWGVYSMTSHDVYGDSIFIIKVGDNYKKLYIEAREAMTNSFVFKYADLDGYNEQNVTLACGDYIGKNFIYYSFTMNTFIDREPAKDSWDLVFTKYYDESIPYIVTGVLTNNDVQVAELHDVDTETDDYSSAEFSKVISVIGSDWKEFDMGSMSYTILDNLVYFIKDRDGDYYKIVFTSFAGSSSGDATFVIEKY